MGVNLPSVSCRLEIFVLFCFVVTTICIKATHTSGYKLSAHENKNGSSPFLTENGTEAWTIPLLPIFLLVTQHHRNVGVTSEVLQVISKNQNYKLVKLQLNFAKIR